jgi:thiosulfate/3-mercaptopyruvate sulfurtransferase
MTPFPALIEADELAALLKGGAANLRLLDASFAPPGDALDAGEMYFNRHIDNALYFDIDEIADKSSPLPHMLPTPAAFESAVAAMGISSDSLIVIYDQTGIAFAAARAWWMFRVFGHDNVRVLNGGLPWWEASGHTLRRGAVPKPARGDFKARFCPELVIGMQDLLKSRKESGTLILDARGFERFSGHAPEPRAGLRSGHIPGSLNIPYVDLLDGPTGRLKPPAALEMILDRAPLKKSRKIVTSCGSGVTACVLALALYVTGRPNVAVYDGSWAEWGREDSPTPVAILS